MDRGHARIVEMLLDHGADINAGLGCMKPLYSAAIRGDTEVVKMLLQRGADANARDLWGRTARDVAYDLGHEPVVAVLDSGTTRSLERRGIGRESDESRSRRDVLSYGCTKCSYALFVVANYITNQISSKTN